MKYKKTEDNIKALADQEPQTPSFDTEDPAHEKSEGADVEKREESNEKALDQSDQWNQGLQLVGAQDEPLK
jgi:hypothetical protein